MELIEVFNRMFFLKINAPQGTAAWAIEVATIIADDLIYLIPALLVVLWLWGNDAQRRLALRACLVALLGVGFNQVMTVHEGNTQ